MGGRPWSDRGLGGRLLSPFCLPVTLVFRVVYLNIEEGGRLHGPLLQRLSGGDLLSQGVAPQVPSALSGFTSVFGMGTGGSQTLTPPDKSQALLEHSIASTFILNSIQALGRLVPVG